MLFASLVALQVNTVGDVLSSNNLPNSDSIFQEVKVQAPLKVYENSKSEVYFFEGTYYVKQKVDLQT